MTTTRAAGPATATPKRHGWWWKLLLAGIALWIITIVVTLWSENSNLIPTLILLGSFLVPLCILMFAAERVRGSLTAVRLMLAFSVGGIVGVLGATVLEVDIQPSWYMYLGVGAAEELVKGIIFIAVAASVMPKDARQGALLGATVGAGFAAFESAGYAFNAALGRLGTIDIASLVQTEILRSLLTPVGHVLWTAILGAAIFAASQRTQRLRLGWGVLLAYVVVVLLHSLWDSMGWLTAWLAMQFTGLDGQIERGFVVRETAQQAADLQTALYWIGLVIVSAIGILVLRAYVRTARVDAVAPA